MSEEKKIPQKSVPNGTAAELLSLLKSLPESEKSKIRSMGIPLPQIAEGSDPTKKTFSYLCRNCGKLALHFLGDKWEMRAPDGSVETIYEVPIGVPFEQLAVTQEMDDAAALYRSPHPRRPRCAFCNHEVALGLKGGIRKGDVVVREPWEKAMAKEKGSRKVRLRNFEREYPEAFVNNRPTGRLHEGASQPILLPQGAKP